MIPIVFSTDHNYVMPTGVTICSLLLSAEGDSYDIYVLISSDVTEEDKEVLRNQVSSLSAQSRISFVDMGEKFSNAFEIRGISKASYYRLMVPWLLPDFERIIYCDVDVIINTPLKELYETDLTGKYVAGAMPSSEGNWYKMRKYFRSLGLNYKNYINAGVLLINSALQRADGLDEKYNELANKKFHYQDQDIINLVCKDKVAYFDFRFNLKPHEYGILNKLHDKVLIHYFGDKPWVDFTYAWDIWWDVYKKSLFWSGEYYHNVCQRILSPKHQIKKFTRKAHHKSQQFISKLKNGL